MKKAGFMKSQQNKEEEELQESQNLRKIPNETNMAV